MNEATGEHREREGARAPVGYFELLRRNRDFRYLWLGQVVSQLGDWFDTIALYTLVLRLTGSGRAVGLVLVARFLPSVVMGPLSGVLADRFNRRTIMIVSDLLRALVVLGFLFVRRPEQLWLIYALTVLQLAFSTFFEPAKTAAIPSLVSTEELVPANAITSVTWSVMLTLGAVVGGAITGAFGTDAAFVLDSVTYLISAALIARIRLPKRPPRPKAKLTLARATGLTDTLEGMRYVRTRPRVLATLLVKPAWGLGGGVLTLLAVFGEKVFPLGGSSATGIGVLYAARGIGTAFGPFIARRIAGDTRGAMQTTIGVSFIVGGLFYIAFGRAGNFLYALVMLGLAHMGGSILWVFSTTLLQSTVEDRFRGRVFAAEMTLLTLAFAVSNYVTGELLDSFGWSPRAVAVATGIVFILPGIVWFITQRWWDNEPDEQLPHAPPQTLTAADALPARDIHLSGD
ncbi:MAG TPA: MFS transporter [Pyrinomonadaceae bacterium]|nr:MFS transporter [Pyrinomonadaceae bacterium]